MRAIQPKEITYIYALIDPRTGTVRYIGKSSTPEERLKRHVGYQLIDDTYKSRWLRGLLAEGYQPVLSIIAEVPYNDWTQHERRWIAYYREVSGEALTNGTAGGDGAWGLTEEGRLKKSVKMSGSNNPFYGKSHSPELQKQIYDQSRGEKNFWFGTKGPMGGKALTEEHKRKISASLKGHIGYMTGKTHTEATKKLVANKLLGIVRSESTRKKMSEAASKRAPDHYKKGVANRKKVPSPRKGTKLSDETRQRMKDAAALREKRKLQDVVCELFSNKKG